MDSEEVAVSVAEIKNDIKWIKEYIESSDKRYAPKLRFVLVERFVYGLIGLVMIAVGTALVAGVVKAAEMILY